MHVLRSRKEPLSLEPRETSWAQRAVQLGTEQPHLAVWFAYVR